MRKKFIAGSVVVALVSGLAGVGCGEEKPAESLENLLSNFDQSELNLMSVGCSFKTLKTFEGLAEERYEVSFSCTANPDYETALKRKTYADTMIGYADTALTREVNGKQRDLLQKKRLALQSSAIASELKKHEDKLSADKRAREELVKQTEKLLNELAAFGCPKPSDTYYSSYTSLSCKLSPENLLNVDLLEKMEKYAANLKVLEANNGTHEFPKFPEYGAPHDMRMAIGAKLMTEAGELAAAMNLNCVGCEVSVSEYNLKYRGDSSVYRRLRSDFASLMTALEDPATKEKILAASNATPNRKLRKVEFGSTSTFWSDRLTIKSGATVDEIRAFVAKTDFNRY